MTDYDSDPVLRRFSATLGPSPLKVLPNMERHPISKVWPDLSDEAWNALCDDIERNGVRVPKIVIHEGMVLDGWHRLETCRALGDDWVDKLRVEHYKGGDPLAFTASLHVHRRQMSTGQKALIAADLSEDSKAGGDRRSENHSTTLLNGLTQSRAAELLDVSLGSIGKAQRLRREAPELAEAVRQGEITLSAAHKQISDKPADNIGQASTAASPTAEIGEEPEGDPGQEGETHSDPSESAEGAGADQGRNPQVDAADEGTETESEDPTPQEWKGKTKKDLIAMLDAREAEKEALEEKVRAFESVEDWQDDGPADPTAADHALMLQDKADLVQMVLAREREIDATLAEANRNAEEVERLMARVQELEARE